MSPTPADFDREVAAVGRCFVCALYGRRHGLGALDCADDRLRPGPLLESHHVVPQRALKAPTSPLWGSPRLLEALCDPRNGIPVGQLHHDAIEDGRIELNHRDLIEWPRAGVLYRGEHYAGPKVEPAWTIDLPAFAEEYDIEGWVQGRLGTHWERLDG